MKRIFCIFLLIFMMTAGVMTIEYVNAGTSAFEAMAETSKEPYKEKNNHEVYIFLISASTTKMSPSTTPASPSSWVNTPVSASPLPPNVTDEFMRRVPYSPPP